MNFAGEGHWGITGVLWEVGVGVGMVAYLVLFGFSYLVVLNIIVFDTFYFERVR